MHSKFSQGENLNKKKGQMPLPENFRKFFIYFAHSG